MMKTKFDSYCIGGLSQGCQHCVKGKKLVLFITGKCLRNCWYCSLSKKRKNKDIIWANERECKSIKDAIKEIRESNADSAGITGGDPLLKLNRTLNFAKAMKKNFKNFHIHIYLPTKLITKEKIKKLSKYIDEIRFHPSFLAENLSEKQIEKEIRKISLSKEFFKKENIGCEFPMIPNKKKEIYQFIKKASEIVGFVNLNEFEISETNFKHITKNYKLNLEGYTIKDSIKVGKEIINKAKKEKLKIKIHLCTAKTKNHHQYKNRIKEHNILPYGKKTEEGTVIYLSVFPEKEELSELEKKISKAGKEYSEDKKKNRINVSERLAKKLIKLRKFRIAKIEEHPTFDRTEMEFEWLNNLLQK